MAYLTWGGNLKVTETQYRYLTHSLGFLCLNSEVKQDLFLKRMSKLTCEGTEAATGHLRIAMAPWRAGSGTQTTPPYWCNHHSIFWVVVVALAGSTRRYLHM